MPNFPSDLCTWLDVVSDRYRIATSNDIVGHLRSRMFQFHCEGRSGNGGGVVREL